MSGTHSRSLINVEGTDYVNRRTFSVILDDPQLDDALTKDRRSGSNFESCEQTFDRILHSTLPQQRKGESRPPSPSWTRSGIAGYRGDSNFIIEPKNLEAHRSTLPSDLYCAPRKRDQPHLQSADLFDNFSPLQKERILTKPKLADVFSSVLTKRNETEGRTCLSKFDIFDLKSRDQSCFEKTHPSIFKNEIVRIYPDSGDKTQEIGADDPGQNEILHRLPDQRRAIRVGIILSGGPAPGGHNVIAGVYDYLKESINQDSTIYGFKGGIDGYLRKDFLLVTDEKMDRFRNTGGFDMFWSGRGKITDCDAALKVAVDLNLNGLIIVGGDGSNSNAAILAEYFGSKQAKCCVIGVPKTIDGDLKNAAIQCSFGFDTAAKTYSELIGNLCTDASCGHGVWHFVRVMGRSASHLVLECAMQTRPNLALIGEEIKEEDTSLSEIVADLVDLILQRAKKGKMYGVVLVPEGLIGFIPEMDRLIQDIPNAFVNGAIDPQRLSEKNRKVWEFLPKDIQDQLSGDREATGYIQVAKIATERLLILLVEKELTKVADYDYHSHWKRMPHYFGYEGRCAMPSNFDANYCYNLGCTAGCLIEHKQNGYMACVTHLDQETSMWVPVGVPFCRLMEMIEIPGKEGKIPGITRQLVDIESEPFAEFKKARQKWRLGDYYRCPGPIQFQEGIQTSTINPIADVANFTVDPPKDAEQLLDGGALMKKVGNMSNLQKERIKWIPPLPKLCSVKAKMVRGSQYLPKDPFTHRQILGCYTNLCPNNEFYLQNFQSDTVDEPQGHWTRRNTPSFADTVCPAPLRVGVVFLSRQAPGMINIVWGVHEMVKKRGGVCLGLAGINGLLDGKYTIISDESLELYKNLGGVGLLGRGTSHELLKLKNQAKVLRVTLDLNLDGLVLIGSSLAMTEAATLANFFIAEEIKRNARRNSRKEKICKVIGIPATASNNVLHDLLETNIGFDTASKLYSSLIGNVLTDAASMPKYWHFIRLMGRQPSNEVLECALQCHPNVVIIAEEYGAGQKTLKDVVNDIADVVCARAMGSLTKAPRNFGAVLIPDGLLHHLPAIRTMIGEIESILSHAREDVQLAKDYILGRKRGPNMDLDKMEMRETKEWELTPWSAAVFNSLPKYIQEEFLEANSELRDSFLETEVLLSQMVRVELEARRKKGRYDGNFQAVCHYFGYQGRSAMPSNFDATLAYAHGHLAVMCLENDLTGHITSIRGLCGPVRDWKLGAIPLNCLMTLIPFEQESHLHPDLSESMKIEKRERPIIPNAEVKLQCKALRWMKVAQEKWQDQDRFCNPGPIQFHGVAADFYHRILHEEQAEYLNMLNDVQSWMKRLADTCNFGVEESFLRLANITLKGLLIFQEDSEGIVDYRRRVQDKMLDDIDESDPGIDHGETVDLTQPEAELEDRNP